jgi:hypothetical protein
MSLAGVVIAFFVLSAVIASAYGRHPESGLADALGSIGWFGFMLSALALVVLTVVSLAARALSRGNSAHGRELT